MKDSMRPLISVCIPAYNSAKYIGDAIESVLSQTCQDYELIIVDNNSQDDTAAIVSRYDDPRIFYIRNVETLSMAENWNKCVCLAQGKYVCLLHADDMFLPNLLEVESNILEGDQWIGLVYGAVRFIDENKKCLSAFVTSPKDYVIKGSEEFKKNILGNYIYCPSIMVRKECYGRAGKFKNALKYHLDWDMWLRIELFSPKVAYVSDVLAQYRLHSSSASSASKIIKTPADSEEWYTVLHGNLTSNEFVSNYSIRQAREIKDKALLKYIFRCLKLILGSYLKNGEIVYIFVTLKFLLSKKFWEKNLRLSFFSIFAVPGFFCGIIFDKITKRLKYANS